MFKKVLLFLTTALYLHASSNAFIFDNDALTGTDQDYTNGFYYTWMGEDGESPIPKWLSIIDNSNKNMAFTLSHLMFTPEDLSQSEKIEGDLPYAGYMNLSFYLYESTKNFFHELGFGFGAVGPITKAERMQKIIHRINGNREPEGWSTQLKNDYMTNVSYQLGYKTDISELGFLEYDWTNNIRVDSGKFYTGALIGTSIRIGNNIPNNFKTTGNFLGGEESELLNFSKRKGFGWAMSIGFFANSIKKFYIVDEYEEYKIGHINYTRGELLTFSLYLRSLEISVKVKKTNFTKTNDIANLHSGSFTKWGSLTFRWSFD